MSSIEQTKSRLERNITCFTGHSFTRVQPLGKDYHSIRQSLPFDLGFYRQKRFSAPFIPSFFDCLQKHTDGGRGGVYGARDWERRRYLDEYNVSDVEEMEVLAASENSHVGSDVPPCGTTRGRTPAEVDTIKSREAKSPRCVSEDLQDLVGTRGRLACAVCPLNVASTGNDRTVRIRRRFLK